MNESKQMCPHCGSTFDRPLSTLIPTHNWPEHTRQVCPGSRQIPRNSISDRRRLWNGEPNPHAVGSGSREEQGT